MTRRSLASLVGALAALSTLASAGAAFAEDAMALGAGYTAFDAPLGAAAQIQIDLRGRVAARCDLVAPLSGFDNFDMNRAGQAQGVFAIDCNTPFILRVRSERGGFASDMDIPGVEVLTPYQVSVQVGTDDGRQNLGWCDAAALSPAGGESCIYAPTAAGGGWSSGDAIAIGQSGSLALRWRDPAGENARAGAYNDTIIIELAVRS